MKMIMAILHKDDELETIEELNIAGYMVTKLATTGGRKRAPRSWL